MLPTWRDIEVQSEIRNTRMLEAKRRHILNQLPAARPDDRATYAEILVRLGTWMVTTGQQLRSRYGDVPSVDPTLRSVGQGC